MKATVYLLYLASLIGLVSAILLLVYYPNSGRMNLIAGGLTMFGIGLNIVSFILKKEVKLGVK